MAVQQTTVSVTTTQQEEDPRKYCKAFIGIFVRTLARTHCTPCGALATCLHRCRQAICSPVQPGM